MNWAVAGSLAVLLLWRHHGRVLNWDEVDYVNAARLGIASNMVDEGSLSPAEYFRLAKAKYFKQAPELPASYYEGKDPLYLRHLHPPLGVYLLSPVARFGSERTLRSVQFLGAILFIGITLLGHRSLSRHPSWAGTLVVGALALWAVWVLFASISFHGWAGIGATASAALTSRWLASGDRAAGVLLCVALAFTFLALESGLFVWAGTAFCLLLWPPRSEMSSVWKPRSYYLLRGLFIVVCFVIVIWPGSLLKVTLLKSILVYGYRIFVVGKEYVGVSSSWAELLQALLPLITLAPLACAWLWACARTETQRWGPFAVIGVVYAAALARFALVPAYILPAAGPLACLIGLAVDRLHSRVASATCLAATLILTACTCPGWPSLDDCEAERAELRFLAEVIGGHEAFVDGGHIYQYYYGPAYEITPICVSYEQELTVRECGVYRKLSTEELAGKIVVLRKRGQTSFAVAEQQLATDRYQIIDHPNIRVYLPH
jgi:hypothetical protein